MPSVGHLALGVAAGRFHARPGRSVAAAMALFSVISCAPDADGIGYLLGIPYGDPFGHRGAFHSLPVALALGIVTALVFGGLGRSRLRMALTATAVSVSHALLDAMTGGGRGAALLWPFTDRRFLLPWRPIPAAPIGLRFFSSRGLAIFLFEMAIFSPLLVYACWPRARAEALAREP